MFCLCLTLPAQNISEKKERKLENRLQCANLLLLQNDKQEALRIYKSIRDHGSYSPIALTASDSLVRNSYYEWNLETIWDCIQYLEKYPQNLPASERIEARKQDYMELYYYLRNNLAFQDDLCGIWVSDYTEDKHKAPYLILEIEKTDGGYVAHLHPTCQVAWKYPTYTYTGKYKYHERTELPTTNCAIFWDKSAVYAHFASKNVQSAHPISAQMFENAGMQILESAKKLHSDVTSDPDFYRLLTSSDRWQFHGATVGLMAFGAALGIIAALLESARSTGYSIEFEGEYIQKGVMECVLNEDKLNFSTVTGEVTQSKTTPLRMYKIYPDYELRFIGYNNWLVGCHSFTRKEARTFSEYKYRGEKTLIYNKKSYGILKDKFAGSDFYDEFVESNEGIVWGAISTEYGFYSGKLKEGIPICDSAVHFFKNENSRFEGVVKDNKRCGSGINYEYGDSTELIKKTIGTWEDGKLSGYVVSDDYLNHQHFEGNYSDGYRSGNGVLTDTANNIVYEGSWKEHWWQDCLNGNVIEKNLDGEVLFIGEYEDNHREGHGREKYWDGSIYEGTWKNGLKDGNGVLQIPEISVSYKQTWKNGILKYGQDIERNQNGDIVFSGEYKNNLRDGSGIERHDDGTIFDGYWKRGLRHGKGVLYDSDRTYNQTWKRGGIKHGTVVERNQNGTVVYEGEYRDNKRGGYGTEYYENGCRYTGHWKNGLKHGRGVLYIPNTNVSYDEEWRNGKIMSSKHL